MLLLMAFSVELDPVLHCKPNDFITNSVLSLRVLNFGMYANDTIFTEIPIAKTVFEPATNLLATMIQDPKATSAEKVAQCRIVHGYLKKNLLQAKITCDHKFDLIEKSGFDPNFQPSKTPAPETAGIVRIAKGKVDNTYKVFLLRKSNKKLVEQDPATHLKGVLFTVEHTLTPDDAASWKAICINMPSTKLIFSASLVTPGKKNYIRVYGTNSAGKGNPCNPKFFTPEIP